MKFDNIKLYYICHNVISFVKTVTVALNKDILLFPPASLALDTHWTEKMFRTKFAEKNKIYILCQYTFFRKLFGFRGK
jgi:hypothetical protein